jgi:hypothetical protein
MKISKLNYIALIVLLLWSTSPSFSQTDPWAGPPPTFEEDNTDDSVPPVLPINTALYVLSMSGVFLAGFFILKRRTRKKQ